VDYEYIAGELREIFSPVKHLRGVAYDRWRMDVMKKAIEKEGLTLDLLPFGQGYKDMSPAIDELEADILNDRMAHGNHPVLTMCAANAITVKDEAGNRKMNKAKATGRIDGIVALCMARGLAAMMSRDDNATILFV
jgi:phage terminase large subunit-like protein